MTTRAQRAATFAYDAAALFSGGRATMSETDWNWHIRQALMRQKFRALHLRETDTVGVPDILVYRVHTIEYLEDKPCYQVIEAWLELKVLDPGRDLLAIVKPAQKEFLRDHWRFGRNAMIVTYDREVDMLAVRQGDFKGRVKMYPPNPYKLDWQEVFAHFKARKVSL